MPDPYWQKVAEQVEKERLFYIKRMASLVSNQRSKASLKRKPVKKGRST